jgi:hypothetical protein
VAQAASATGVSLASSLFSPDPLLTAMRCDDKNAGTFIHRAHAFVRELFSTMRILGIAVQIKNPAQPFPHSRRNRDANEMGHN